jgi:hypothetical protein
MVRAPGRTRSRCAGCVRQARAAALRLKVNTKWTPTLETRVRLREQIDSARAAALRALARTGASMDAQALSTRLATGGHPRGAISSAIRELREDGWLRATITRAR